MLTYLRTYLEPLLDGVSPHDDLEEFVHEIAHLVTLTSVPKTRHLLMNSDGISVKQLLEEKLTTARSQDSNEMRTTAVTILAMEHLGGGTFVESISNMFMNLQTLHPLPALKTEATLKLAKEPFLLKAVYMMLERRTQALAKSMVFMLHELEATVAPLYRGDESS